MQNDPDAMVDGEPAGAAFEVVAVEDRAHPIRHVRLAIAAAAMVVVAAVGGNLLPTSGDGPVSGSAASPSSERSPSPSRADTRTAIPELLAIEPGSYYLRAPYDSTRPPMRIILTVPAGWASAEGRTAIYKPEGDWRYPDTNRPALAVHAVTGVSTDVCRSGPDVPFENVGPTVEDMMTALATLVGPEGPGPTDVMLGGYPAKRFVLTDILDSCGGPEGRLLWENATGSHFGLLKGGTATIYVVDVDGDRLVIASHERGSPAEDVAELDAIVASIDIERGVTSPRELRPEPEPRPSPREGMLPWGRDPQGDLPIGRYALVVENVGISFRIPQPGWESFGSFYISKSTVGPQGAAAIIFWTSLRGSVDAHPCPHLLEPSVGPSAADLAAAVATMPGTAVVTGRSDVSVGERAAQHVVLTVQDQFGCDPGFFYTWDYVLGGAFWADTQPGDTVRVWIVDVGGTRIFIEAETHKNASPELEWEIQQIVDSIRFG